MDGEIFTNPAQIAQVLQRVQDARSLLFISFPGENIPYQSAILEINPDKEYLLLDEITPARGHKKFLESGTLIANTKIKGVDIRFDVQLDQELMESGIAMYKVHFPKRLVYMQKRQSYRINLGITSKISISLQTGDGTILQGKVLNISETGVGANIDARLRLKIGDQIPLCELEIPDNETIQSKLEIRFVEPDKSSRLVRIGGRFLGISGIQQRQLARVLLDLQRDMMRRLPKDSL